MEYYLNILKDIYESAVSTIKTSISIKEKTDAFEHEMKSYLDFIPEFFSETGDAKSIKNMYALMGDKRHANKCIDYVDINQSSYVYNEYTDGMRKFISEIIESDIVQESTDVINKLDSAISNDSLFIESIFGGSNNEIVNDTVKDASRNLEFLVDFIPSLESYIIEANSFSDRIQLLSKDSDVTVLKTLDMYMESVSHYSHQVIKNVINTYANIQSALHEDTTSGSQKPQFALY